MANRSGIEKFPHLFSPIQIGGTVFRNRIFASPTGYHNLNGDGYLNDGAIAYYTRRAIGGAGSVSTGECIVDGKLGKATSTHLCLDTPGIEHGLARIAHGIRQYGGVPTIEFEHAGMYANRNLVPGHPDAGLAYGPVETVMKSHGPVDGSDIERVILPMTEEIIERTIKKYIDSAVLAKKIGYGMILLHAGHGWMLHQFLSPLTNTRTDKWGGPAIENRARLLVTIIDGIHQACGSKFPVEVRISGSECYDGGFGIEEGIAIAKQIDGHADLIHVSAGNHEVDEVFTQTHPSMFKDDGCNVWLAAEIKKHVNAPVATVGALSEPELMEEIIASGQADVIECGRQFMADSDFPNKLRVGHESNMRKCMRCLNCFSQHLTHGESYCAINPESGRELEARSLPTKADVQKKVLVVGGGCGGMQAALTAAEMGHEVILCEKENRLGGVLRCEGHVDFKTKLDYYLNQQERLCMENPSIDVRLNIEVTPEYAKAQDVDVVIAANGAAPIVPTFIKGYDRPNVMAAEQAYNAVDKLGQKVIIIGAGLVGVELGLHLRHLGKDVDIIEMTDHVNDGGNFLHMSGLRVEIKKRELNIHFETAVQSIEENGVACKDKDGNDLFFEGDSVVYAIGMAGRSESAMALYDVASEFYMIGDCIGASNICNATSGAYMTAKNIGRNY